MLVLTRRPGESIIIGDDIEIMVTDVRGDGVRIGISAPKNVRVMRKELLCEIAKANRAAAEVHTKISLPPLQK